MTPIKMKIGYLMVGPTINGCNVNTYVHAMVGDVDSLDPAFQYDGVSNAVVMQVYEPLIFYRGSSIGEFEPLLATQVPSAHNGLIQSSGTVYVFPIRTGVFFHNGETLSAEDVKYSLMRYMLQDRDGGPSSLLLEPVLGILSSRGPDGKPLAGLYERLDDAIRVQDNAVSVRLAKPFAPFLSVLAGWGMIVSKKWAAANGDWDGGKNTWVYYNNPKKESSPFFGKANGTGPFALKRWDLRGQKLYLERNDRYWRKPAKLKRLIFATVSEFNTRKLLLAAGDADSVFAERQYLPQLSQLPGVTVLDDLPRLEVTNMFAFTFDINPAGNKDIGSGKLDGDGIPPDFFADRDVRKAFAYAFDYDAYIRDGFRGKATQARGPIPKGLMGYNPKQPVYTHAPDKAVEHFKKAFGGRVWEKGFRFTLSHMEGRSDRQLACQILKRTVESLNPKFRIDVRAVLWSTLLAMETQHKTPLVNARWGLDYPDSHNCVGPFLHSQGHYPRTQGYSNPDADRLIELAITELDGGAREKIYRKLLEIAHADVPQIYTVDTVELIVQRAWVRGRYYNPVFPAGYFYPVHKVETN